MKYEKVIHPSKESIQAFAEGRLVSVESSHIEEHLLNCDTCCDHLANQDDGDLIELARRANELEKMEQGFIEPGLVPAALKNHPRYRVIESIAVGAMGVVFRAEHLLMQRTVALKVIHPSFLSNSQAIRRFHQEVRIAAQLNHPNIVASHDAEQAGELHFLVMEYVDGMTLAQYVQRNGPAMVAQARDWVRQAASALEHAHQLGLTHRDIKPANLMITGGGTLKILDFGLSRLDSSHWPSHDGSRAEKNSATLPDMFLGTPGYASPEQIANASQADIRSDIYSLGCTLYFLLAKRAPFTRNSIVQTLHAQQTEPLPDICELRKDIPQLLAEILGRMTAKDPKDRFATPTELLGALNKVDLGSEQPVAQEFSTDATNQDTHRDFLTLVESAKTSHYKVNSTKRTNDARRRRWIAIGVAFIPALAIIGVLIVSATNQWFTAPRANLLVMMPSTGLCYDDYHALVEAAYNSNVKLHFVSTRLGAAEWFEGYGRGTAAATSIINPDLQAIQYDGIVFIGCDTGEFLPGSPHGTEVNRLVNEFESQSKLLIGIGTGQRGLGQHGMLRGKSIARCAPIEAELAKYNEAILSDQEIEQDGQVVTASWPRDTAELMERVVSILKK